MQEIKNYAEFLKASRKNFQPDGFNFDVNEFENLIDCWTPQEKIPTILRCKHVDLDRFCMIVYNMNFNDTYNILSGISDAIMRKTLKGLAETGSTAAIQIVAKHFMKLKEEEDKKAISITFLNDLNKEEQD